MDDLLSEFLTETGEALAVLDVELVKFDSAVFAESQAEPTEQQIREHFDKYKKFTVGYFL